MIGGNGMNEVGERPERTSARPYRTFVDGAVALQERSFWYAFGAMNGSVREIQRQTSRRHAGYEASLDTRPVEGQRRASSLVEGPVSAYFGLLFAPLSFWSRPRPVSQEISPQTTDVFSGRAEPEVPVAPL